MQDEHAHVGAGIARGERLTVGPDADDGIAPAGVELGDDGAFYFANLPLGPHPAHVDAPAGICDLRFSITPG